MWSEFGSLFGVSRGMWILQLCHVILLTAEACITSSLLSSSLEVTSFTPSRNVPSSHYIWWLWLAETSWKQLELYTSHCAVVLKGVGGGWPSSFVLSDRQLSRVRWKLVNANEYDHLKKLFVVYIATPRRSILWKRYVTKNETKGRGIEGRAQGIKTEPENERIWKNEERK
jgi:hypothetical protein